MCKRGTPVIKNVCSHIRYWAIGLVLCTLAACNFAQVYAASPQFLADCQALTAGSHRLTGSRELTNAANYMEKRFREAGVDQVVVQQFSTVQLVTKRCDLTIAGAKRSIALQPMRPDGIITPVTPLEGITGQILHAGKGELTDYGNRSPQGKIVVLDYNSYLGWMRAFRLGAKAVIFVSDGPALSIVEHYTEANANFPRFYLSGGRKLLSEGATVTIHSEVTWQPSVGHNVIAFIRGTKPTFHLGQPESILIAAPLDTFGEIPNLSPGSRGAANCAALIKIAQQYAGQRPQRNVVLAAFDGQSNGHLGVSAFYRVFEEENANVKLDYRKRVVKEEQRQVNAMLSALRNASTMRKDQPVFRTLTERLSFKAAEHVYLLNAMMEDIRRSAITETDQGNKDTLSGQMAEYQRKKDRWNDVRRALARQSLPKLQSSTLRPYFEEIIAEVRTDVITRQQELAVEEMALVSDQQIKSLIGKTWISLHVSLLFGDTTPRWGLLIGGDSAFHSFGDSDGLYGKLQGLFASSAKNFPAAGRPVAHFALETADGSMKTRIFWPGKLVHSGEIAGRLGIYNIAIGTVQESLWHEGTPDDTLANLDITKIETQADEFATLLQDVAKTDGLSLNRSIVPSKAYIYPDMTGKGGATVMGTSLGSSMPNKLMPGAVVQLLVQPLANFAFQSKIPGFNNFQVLMTDANAIYRFGPVIPDPTNITLRGFAAVFNERGNVLDVSDTSSAATVQTRLNVFHSVIDTTAEGVPTSITRAGAAILPPQVENNTTLVMDSISNGALNPAKSNAGTLDGVAYWYCDRSVDGVKLFGLQSIVAVLNRDSHVKNAIDDMTGGLPLQDQSYPESSLRSANDLWQLNEERIDVLRSKGITNSALEELHWRTRDLLDASKATSDIAGSDALASSAFMGASPVYQTVLQSLNDIVRAVIILMALAIPFAFSLERLIIGSTNIYKQIIGFCAFFAVTFLMLFLVHPAFKLSTQPVIIFLAFALIGLSSMVIVVLMQKFESELKILQGLTSTVHTADVSRFSTMMAAMSMGISTMRRRPMRTALTAITIMLLTFTILNFASFDTSLGIVKLPSGAAPKYTGVYVHRMNWTTLNPELMSTLQGRWGKDSTITSRYWLPAGVLASDGPLLTRDDGSKPYALKGVLGLDAMEVNKRADIQSLLGTNGAALTNGIFLTDALAKSLDLAVGSEVILGGNRLRVAGILNAARLTSIQDMDGSSLLPVDFSANSSSQLQQQQQQVQVGVDALASAQNKQDWVVLPPDSVAIISNEVAKNLGATLRVVSMYTPDAKTAASIADDAARILPLPVCATRPEGVFSHILAPAVQAKGVKDLIFPILLGGLVIFGTMLGSVADREKEIYTFSALGLAPVHVATLFFAEALVYSFIGGLGGYLFAQGVQKILGVMVTWGWVSGMPEMNYSSMNAIFTILIVMATVLVSAIYPAIKASRSANPGVLRSWKLKDPEGDNYHITFPFTVSQYDITGVISFLKEHFDNFTDTSLGVFMSRETEIVRENIHGLGIKSNLALAPFDLGVTQDFLLYSAPSEIQGIDEVKIDIVRNSGQQKDWIRLNKVLLEDLRRQFLIWRSLPQETMELYRQRTLVALGEKKETADIIVPTVSQPIV